MDIGKMDIEFMTPTRLIGIWPRRQTLEKTKDALSISGYGMNIEDMNIGHMVVGDMGIGDTPPTRSRHPTQQKMTDVKSKLNWGHEYYGILEV